MYCPTRVKTSHTKLDLAHASLREAQKQLTRDRLVEQAPRLFTETGNAATKSPQAPALPGVIFYAYYPSHSDLMGNFITRVDALLDQVDGPLSVHRRRPARRRARMRAAWHASPGSSLAPRSGRSSHHPSTCPMSPRDREVRTLVKERRAEVISGFMRGMQLAGPLLPETHRIRGTLAFTQLDYVSTLWTLPEAVGTSNLATHSAAGWPLNLDQTPPEGRNTGGRSQ